MGNKFFSQYINHFFSVYSKLQWTFGSNDDEVEKYLSFFLMTNIIWSPITQRDRHTNIFSVCLLWSSFEYFWWKSCCRIFHLHTMTKLVYNHHHHHQWTIKTLESSSRLMIKWFRTTTTKIIQRNICAACLED